MTVGEQVAVVVGKSVMRWILLASALWTVAPVAAHPPVVEAPTPFASGLAGPEGLAFARDGSLIVGTVDGDLRRVAPDGTHTLLGNVGDRLAGVTVLRDGRILACAFGAGRVWSVDPVTGVGTIYATVDSPNWVLQTRGHVLVSSSFAGNIVDITDGHHVVVASGLSFPNALAVRRRMLYVAETIPGRVVRLPRVSGAEYGPIETYASGMQFADGIAFDRPGNLFVVGSDRLWVVDVKTQAVTLVSTDPLLEWPSSIAFGSRAYGRTTMFLPNFGPGLGDGTTLIRVPTNHPGARLTR